MGCKEVVNGGWVEHGQSWGVLWEEKRRAWWSKIAGTFKVKASNGANNALLFIRAIQTVEQWKEAEESRPFQKAEEDQS